MAIQESVGVRNARLDAIETTIGTAPQLRLYTGTQPADCATAPSGSLLATLTLPSDWLANAASGAKSKSGTWSGTGSAGGTAGYFRIYDSTGTTCHFQGSVGQGSGDLSLDNTVIANGQAITISTFTINAANA